MSRMERALREVLNAVRGLQADVRTPLVPGRGANIDIQTGALYRAIEQTIRIYREEKTMAQDTLNDTLVDITLSLKGEPGLRPKLEDVLDTMQAEQQLRNFMTGKLFEVGGEMAGVRVETRRKP